MEDRKRFFSALGAYLVLGVLAGIQLDGKLRASVLILLGALAFLTWVHARRRID